MASRLDELEAACRRRGLPITVQRRVILETLAGREDHPTADEIFVHVRRRLPEVSRTTVYRVLDTLVRLGLAVKLSHPGNGARFDPRTERHHHVVCTRCEKVVDLHLPALDALPLPAAGAFEVNDYSVHFRGLCGNCRDRRLPGRVSMNERSQSKRRGGTEEWQS